MDDITTLPLVITIHFLHYIFKLLTAENLVAFESDRQRGVCVIDTVCELRRRRKIKMCEVAKITQLMISIN